VDGIRDFHVTGVQTCALPILMLFWIATGAFALGPGRASALAHLTHAGFAPALAEFVLITGSVFDIVLGSLLLVQKFARAVLITKIGRASCRERAYSVGGARSW